MVADTGMKKGIFYGGKIIIVEKISVFFIFINLILLPVISCHGIKNGENIMSVNDIVTVKKQDEGKEISVKRGDIVQIELQAMGSTGYTWYVDAVDSKHLELIETGNIPLKKGVLGSPRLVTWRFRALEKGKTEIRMNYYRHWEGIDRAIDHFSIKLNIQ